MKTLDNRRSLSVIDLKKNSIENPNNTAPASFFRKKAGALLRIFYK